MNVLEKNAIVVVAKLAPWLAPLPSAYFVARSAIHHLALPVPMAVVVAAIIETLGLTTVHTALWAYDWNSHKRKTDPSAPVGVAVVLGAVYLAATWGLVVFLEVWPNLATYAPAIFPALAVVGAFNLAMIARQEQKEATVRTEKTERKTARQARSQTKRRVSSDKEPDAMVDALSGRKAKRNARMNALLAFYVDNPQAGPTEAGRAIGVSRQTIYTYLADLENASRLARRNGRVEVLSAASELQAWGHAEGEK